MAVKLVSREQVAQESRLRRAPGPVNALGFKRSEVAEQSASSEFAEPRPSTRHDSERSPSPMGPALTDEDSESYRPRRMRRQRTVANRRRQPGVIKTRKRSRRPERTLARPAPRVSRRVRQLQAQHEYELRQKRAEGKEETQREEHDEPKSAGLAALPSQVSEELGLQELPEKPSHHEQHQTSRVQSDPSTDKRSKRSKICEGEQPRDDWGHPVIGQEEQLPGTRTVPKSEATTMKTAPVPALALRRWRQARKRQQLLRQMSAMQLEMKFERRQLLSALQRPFNISSLEAEVQKHGRELKSRFRALYMHMFSEQQERQKRLRVLKVLGAEHLELQRAFVKLMNECGFARPSALRMPASPKPTAEGEDDQEDLDDDDVIVEKEPNEDQKQEIPSKQQDELKKEMQQEALRAELLLRALDAGSIGS